MTLSVAIKHRQGEFQLDAAVECAGGVTALFGRSGAGKSTLVNAIAGLVRPEAGRIELDGEILFDSARGVSVPPQRRHFGCVFQEGRLFPHLTVRQNLLYATWFDRRPLPDGEWDRVVALLGLADLLGRRPARLSGGEKQRVAIGRALLARPRLLLLDEPLAALDGERKTEVLRYLERLRDELRIPMIYVSHTVEEVVRLASRVVLMHAGRSVATGSVEEVMGRTDLPDGAGVFEGGSVIDATVTALDTRYGLATLVFDGGTLAIPHAEAKIGQSVRVRIRARDVSIALDEPRNISIQNVLAANVVSVGTPRDGIVDVSAAAGSVTLRSRITQRAADRLDIVPGRGVYLLIKAVSLDRRGAGHV